MPPPSSFSPFVAAIAAATVRKTSRDAGKTCQEEETIRPGQLSPLSSKTAQNPLWKGLKLTPTKRTSREDETGINESTEVSRTIADFATRTQRKVFSTGFFYKKLKRFQKDSPSSLSQRKEGSRQSNSNTSVSVVDLCSSDEEESQSEECAGKASSDTAPKKDTSQENESLAMGSSITPRGGAATASSQATSPGSAIHPPVDLCSSDEEKELFSFDTENAVCPVEKPIPERGVVLNGEKSLSWKEYALKLSDRQSEIFDSNPTGVANQETKKSHHSFVLGTFSIERKRLLLDVLAPVSLSPEAMKAESWMSKDANCHEVSKAFSQRFGCLSTTDLAQLARGDFLVPDGMVSVKETLRAYRISREKATKFSVKKTPSESTTNETAERSEEAIDEYPKTATSVGFNLDSGNLSSGKETTSEGQNVAESSFAWDGTFNFLPKYRSVGEPSGTDFAASASSEDKNVRKDDAETGTTRMSNDFQEGQTKYHASIGFESPKKGVPIDKVQLTDPCKKNQNMEYEENKIKLPYFSGQNLSEGSESKNTCEGAIETSEPKDGCVGAIETPQSKDFCENGGLVVGSQREVEDSVETTIVEYIGHEPSTENPEGYMMGFREARIILGDIVTNMTNIVETVNISCRQERERHPEQVEIDIVISDTEKHEQLKLEESSEVTFPAMSNKEEDHKEKSHPFIIISTKQLIVLALPLVGLAGIVRRLGLFDVSNSILEGCFRTFLQLHVLGSLLSPIFKHGAKHPGLVGCYALFMIVLASYEASSRTKYTHDGQFTIIIQSLVLNVGWVAMWAFGAILKPRPVWNPRYLLPIVGMLLGNSINGISITLDTIATSLVEKQSEVDLYQSFGADQYEAVSGIVAYAIKKGTAPFLNMMCVVGIVSIPGMMTGQILGGSNPMVAARYQAMIIFLIALSTLSTILLSSCLTVMSAFCSQQILRPDRFVKNRKRGIARLILWVWGYIFGGRSDLVPVDSNGIPGGNGGGLLVEVELNTRLHSQATGFEIRPLKKGSVVADGEGTNSLFQASGLYRYFNLGDESAENSGTDYRRVLFNELSFGVNEGDLLLVSGPSGTGKSQLLRIMAGLSPLQDGTLKLKGKSWKGDYNGNSAAEWRRNIRYVTQTKVQIPGTPLQFIKKIQSFRSWKTEDDRIDNVMDNDFMKHVSHHIRQWGMGLECLDKEWSVLSGGESQRVLMAIALASRPKILLFDESTSALDHASKLAVETSIKDFVEDHEGGVLWVSHDKLQAERMMDDFESNGTHGH